MSYGIDFVTRAHALWRVRMAHWQQRFGFFAKLILVSSLAGAIVVPQLRLMPEEVTVAVQYIGASLLTLLGDLSGKDMMMKVSMDGLLRPLARR